MLAGSCCQRYSCYCTLYCPAELLRTFTGTNQMGTASLSRQMQLAAPNHVQKNSAAVICTRSSRFNGRKQKDPAQSLWWGYIVQTGMYSPEAAITVQKTGDLWLSSPNHIPRRFMANPSEVHFCLAMPEKSMTAKDSDGLECPNPHWSPSMCCASSQASHSGPWLHAHFLARRWRPRRRWPCVYLTSAAAPAVAASHVESVPKEGKITIQSAAW